MQFRQARNYPVDLYYIMDLSQSMADDKNKLAELGDLLGGSFDTDWGFNLGLVYRGSRSQVKLDIKVSDWLVLSNQSEVLSSIKKILKGYYVRHRLIFLFFLNW